ncbi:MAG: GldG family protein [Chloroflexota bacterium]
MREKLYEWADYFAAIAFALWVAAGILFLLKNQPHERLLALAAVGVVFFLLFLYFKFGLVRQVVTSRTARYGSNALVLSIAVIAIIGVLNFMGERYHTRYDATASKSFTLSDKTIQILQNLKEPIQAIGFYTTDNFQAQQEVSDRLREYARVTDKLTYRFVDPYAEPQLANDYKVQIDGTVVFERGKRRENVFAADEQSFTNAIFKVSQDQQPAVYFTTGHGEHDPGDSGNDGFSLMKTALEAENYKVDVLNLTTLTSTLPSDITALIIAGPKQPFDPGEVKYVKDYLDNHGRVLVMVDPQVESGLDGLLKEWGLAFRNDTVIDPRFGFFGQAQVPVITSYKSHAVTQDMAGQSSFFQGARSIQALTSPESSRSPSALFSTSDQSWGETDFASVKANAAKLDDQDTKGPLDLAYAVEDRGDNPARLVVFGNSNFITNGTLNARISVGGQQQRIQSGNGLLFGNAIHWLAGQETLIAIETKPSDSRPVILTAEQTTLIVVSSVILVPAVILIIGALVWWRRR